MATSDLTGAPSAIERSASELSPADRAAPAAASYVRTPRVAVVGVIGRTERWTVSTVRTAEGVTGTVTAVAR